MVIPLLCLALIGLVLIASETLWNKRILYGEVSRKFVHIGVGVFIASWPFLMSFFAIQVVSVVLLIGVVVSRALNIFHSVHTVPRRTWGEIMFALAIGLAATFAHSRSIFAAAILHMSLADGLAAVAGTKLLKTKAYKIFGQRKTYIGTITFYGVSLCITTGILLRSGPEFVTVALPILALMPIAVTIVESLAVYGTDNLLVPLFVVAVLNSLQSVL